MLRTRSFGVVFLALLAAFGGLGLRAWSHHAAAEERRGLEARLWGLHAQGVAPGSALACLEAPLGEMLEPACERSLFANADSVAAALAATTQRLELLREGRALAAHSGGLDGTVERLRRPLERDQFGLLAHALASRDACTADKCDALELLLDDTRVRSNLNQHRFETVLARYAANWTTTKTNVPPEPSVTGSVATGTRAPLPPSYTLPSVASIPPVSIMSPEPGPAAGTGFPPLAKETPSRPAAAVPPSKPPPSPPRAAQAAKPPPVRPQTTSPGAPARQNRTAPPAAPATAPEPAQ